MTHNPQDAKESKHDTDCKTVALKLPKISLKLPKISLSKAYFGQFKGYILCSGNVGGFFASEGGSCHRGLTIVLILSFVGLVFFLLQPSLHTPRSNMCAPCCCRAAANLASTFVYDIDLYVAFAPETRAHCGFWDAHAHLELAMTVLTVLHQSPESYFM